MEDADGKVTTYTYDQQNQLVRSDDQKANVSTVYTYDVGGNITAVKTYAYTTCTLGAQTGGNSYSYGDGDWKDLMTAYNGQAVTYDTIGNLLSYRDGMSFTWEGHQLKAAVANGQNASYTYNSDGIRTGKTAAGVTTTYFLDGSTILAQKTGNDVLWFLYDSDGTRVGFTYNGTAYYYTTNAQGDVTGIVDKDCNTVVEYSYDAWGKLLSTTGSLAGTIGKINPFLYRGYYYDSETGFYYLNSRYYDPQTRRFLNADGQLNTVTYNLFAYCNNSLIDLNDPEGTNALSSAIQKCVYFASNYWLAISPYGKAIILSAKVDITTAGNAYLRSKKYNLAATMFNKGLWGPGGNLSGSQQNLMINEIKRSVEFRNAVGRSLSGIRGNSIRNKKGSVEFRSGDLYYSIQHADLYMSGTKKNGHWSLNVSMSDVYDFTEIRIVSHGLTLGNLANDLGTTMQSLGMMRPYKWSISFSYTY